MFTGNFHFKKDKPVQSDSLSDPVVMVFRSSEQSVHFVLPTVFEYVFAGQSVQTPSFSYRPMGHFTEASKCLRGPGGSSSKFS